MVLDQPEDDLDNHLIYEMIVTQLHNPYIVVNGGDELVVALKSAGNMTAREAQGSLQDREARDLIRQVMEGGREAFADRDPRLLRSRAEPLHAGDEPLGHAGIPRAHRQN